MECIINHHSKKAYKFIAIKTNQCQFYNILNQTLINFYVEYFLFKSLKNYKIMIC